MIFRCDLTKYRIYRPIQIVCLYFLIVEVMIDVASIPYLECEEEVTHCMLRKLEFLLTRLTKHCTIAFIMIQGYISLDELIAISRIWSEDAEGGDWHLKIIGLQQKKSANKPNPVTALTRKQRFR